MVTQAPKVILREDSFLVINKPFGLVVNRAESVKGETLQDWLEKEGNVPLSQEEKPFYKRSGIAHRLDKDTSGVLLVARQESAFESLLSQFKKRQVKKEYLALVQGKLKDPRGKIDLPVARNQRNRFRFGVFLGGKQAETSYATVANYQKGSRFYSFLKLNPKTGRTHQLRVHLKHLHHPIVSDPIYQGRKNYREDIKWCPRLFLHARKITFTHPISGEEVTCQAPLPGELKSALSKLVKI
ncbi:RluA family pseudouridine synthase [Patescibacteria group bacterium]